MSKNSENKQEDIQTKNRSESNIKDFEDSISIDPMTAEPDKTVQVSGESSTTSEASS